MKLPMPVFWHLSGTVPRLLAGERRDTLEINTSAAHNPEQAAELYTRLSDLAPEPIKLTGRALAQATSVRDEAGFSELKSMAAG
jgi:hypothetical protein